MMGGQETLFYGFSLEQHVPDHSTFSKNRHGRFRDSDVLRYVFEETVRRCLDEGLISGEGFAVDASLIKADANRQRGVPGTEGHASMSPSRAVREYIEVLDDAAFGGATRVTPKFLSPADPAARWTGQRDDGCQNSLKSKASRYDWRIFQQNRSEADIIHQTSVSSAPHRKRPQNAPVRGLPDMYNRARINRGGKPCPIHLTARCYVPFGHCVPPKAGRPRSWHRPTT